MVELHCEYLGAGKTKKKRKRFAPVAQPDLVALQAISGEWKALLLECLSHGGASRWESWQKLAGLERKTLLEQLSGWLLRFGWIVIYEEFRSGDWWPYKLEWQHENALRKALGLSIASEQADCLQALLAQIAQRCADQADWWPALDSLQAMPVRRAIARAELLLALQAWQEQQRSGTRRDFALLARGDTKDITEAEWAWLEEQLDLAGLGIAQHTPTLLLAAPLVLQLPAGSVDLGAAPDFIALTPASIAAATQVQGTIASWQLVENRTSFERVARARAPGVGVIWLPGYPPGWWQAMVARLLALAPAPAQMACDPDPAGIAIVMAAARIWQQQGLAFAPWHMAAADLRALGKRRPLTGRDREQLARLQQQALPAGLEALAQAMMELGEKGEQEGYV